MDSQELQAVMDLKAQKEAFDELRRFEDENKIVLGE